MDDNFINTNKQVLKNERQPLWFSFVFLFLLIIVDQLVKYFVFHSSLPSAKNLLPWFGFHKFLNYNFAFSLPIPLPVMYIIYAAALGGIFVYIKKHYKSLNRFVWVAWLLIVAGALSNIGERVMVGYVKDFIYIFGGIFNLADGYITLGIIMLLFYSPRR